MTDAPETIWAGPSEDDKGVFWDVGHWDADFDKDCIEYTRTDKAQAQVEGFQERISELVALLDQQLGTPCEAIRHAQEIEESQARIAEFKVTLEWYAAHVADCRKLGRDGDVARGKLDRDGGTKAREALKVTS
jgi:hypothetical protein